MRMMIVGIMLFIVIGAVFASQHREVHIAQRITVTDAGNTVTLVSPQQPNASNTSRSTVLQITLNVPTSNLVSEQIATLIIRAYVIAQLTQTYNVQIVESPFLPLDRLDVVVEDRRLIVAIRQLSGVESVVAATSLREELAPPQFGPVVTPELHSNVGE